MGCPFPSFRVIRHVPCKLSSEARSLARPFRGSGAGAKPRTTAAAVTQSRRQSLMSRNLPGWSIPSDVLEHQLAARAAVEVGRPPVAGGLQRPRVEDDRQL